MVAEGIYEEAIVVQHDMSVAMPERHHRRDEFTFTPGKNFAYRRVRGERHEGLIAIAIGYAVYLRHSLTQVVEQMQYVVQLVDVVPLEIGCIGRSLGHKLAHAI